MGLLVILTGASGTKRITVTNNASLALNNDFTLDGWIYKTSEPGTHYQMMFYSGGGGIYLDAGCRWTDSRCGKLSYYDYRTAQWSDYGNLVPLNSWQHVAIVEKRCWRNVSKWRFGKNICLYRIACSGIRKFSDGRQ